jgi:hypothetical protein
MSVHVSNIGRSIVGPSPSSSAVLVVMSSTFERYMRCKQESAEYLVVPILIDWDKCLDHSKLSRISFLRRELNDGLIHSPILILFLNRYLAFVEDSSIG